jgi:hypothetical protein
VPLSPGERQAGPNPEQHIGAEAGSELGIHQYCGGGLCEVPIVHQEEIMKRFWTEDAMERQSEGKNRRQTTRPTVTYNTDLTIHTKKANNLMDGLAEHQFENKSL